MFFYNIILIHGSANEEIKPTDPYDGLGTADPLLYIFEDGLLSAQLMLEIINAVDHFPIVDLIGLSMFFQFASKYSRQSHGFVDCTEYIVCIIITNVGSLSP